MTMPPARTDRERDLSFLQLVDLFDGLRLEGGLNAVACLMRNETSRFYAALQTQLAQTGVTDLFQRRFGSTETDVARHPLQARLTKAGEKRAGRTVRPPQCASFGKNDGPSKNGQPDQTSKKGLTDRAGTSKRRNKWMIHASPPGLALWQPALFQPHTPTQRDPQMVGT